jgi:hypothetical protein
MVVNTREYYTDEYYQEILAYERLLLSTFHSITYEERAKVAMSLLEAGEPYSCSSGIHDYITCGYGLLDANGFWQYPLPDGESISQCPLEVLLAVL